MISYGALFKVADNTGVKKIMYLNNLSRKSKTVCLGDLIVGVVKLIKSTSKLIYSDIIYGVVIRLKISCKYSSYRSNENAVVLVDKNLNPLGSRIFGSVPKYLKEKKCLKLNSLTIDLI